MDICWPVIQAAILKSVALTLTKLKDVALTLTKLKETAQFCVRDFGLKLGFLRLSGG